MPMELCTHSNTYSCNKCKTEIHAELARTQSKLDGAVKALEFYGGKNWNDPIQQGNCRTFHGQYSEIDFSDLEKDKDGDLVGGKLARETLQRIKGTV